MVRTDTFGAYRWDPNGTSPIGTTGCWTQLINGTSMPANFLSGAPSVAGVGIYEIQMCYSSPAVVYMAFIDVEATSLTNGTVWKSTNSGNTWTRTAFTPVNYSSNMPPNGSTKTSGPKICINPGNSNQLFVGTLGAGLFKSTDGNTFSAVTTGAGGVPAPTSGQDYNGMCWSVSNSNLNVYIVSNGNGAYGSTNGGSTWALLGTGGPTTAAWAAIDENNGHYWVLDQSGGLWVWNGTWSNPVTSATNVNSFAIDPALANHLVYNFSNNTLAETFNGFGSSVISSTPTFAGDIPWLTSAGSSANAFSCTAAAYFDRTTSKTIWQSSNLGTWLTTPWSGNISGSTNPAFNVQGRGMEQQVGLEVVVPPGGNPLFTVWDNGIFPQTDNNISAAYPTVLRPQAAGTGHFTACWSLDYSGGMPSFCAMIGTGQYEGGVDHLATSSDGGQTWTSIQSNNPTNDSNGACVAVSDSNHFIVGDCNARQPYYTLNGGNSWTAITLPGTPAWTNFGGLEGRGKWIIADKVTAGNFAMSFAGLGIFTSTNNGVTFSGPFNSSVTNNNDDMFKPVPGQAGHAIIHWSPGAVNNLQQNNTFFITTNLYAGASQAWTGISNMKAVYAAGFGAAAVGTTYPTLFVAGYTSLACSNSVSNAVANGVQFTVTGAPSHTLLPGSPVVMSAFGNGDMRGTVQSYAGGTLTVNIDSVIDGGAGPFTNWTAQTYGIFQTTGNSAPGATPIWTQIGIFPANSLDNCQNISGDPNIYGRVYFSTGGQSFFYYG